MRIIQSPSPVSLSLHKVVTSNISFFCMTKASFLQLEAMDFRLDGYDHNSFHREAVAMHCSIDIDSILIRVHPAVRPTMHST